MALVLAGGGLLGIAWELGVLRGLREAGIDPANADLVVGTSAGSVTGAILGSGVPLTDALLPEASSLGRELERLMQGADSELAGRIFELWQADGGTPDQPTRAQIGALARQATTVPEREYVALFNRLLPPAPWPRTLTVTAVDVDDGGFVTWTATSGVPLVSAVAASCALPGLFPPVTVGSQRCMDGGVRSGVSADLALGHDPVVVIVPIGGDMVRAYMERETADLRASGAGVIEIVADEASGFAMGADLMDASRLVAALEAGLRQGARAAENRQRFSTHDSSP
jgi:NTE family protein